AVPSSRARGAALRAPGPTARAVAANEFSRARTPLDHLPADRAAHPADLSSEQILMPDLPKLQMFVVETGEKDYVVAETAGDALAKTAEWYGMPTKDFVSWHDPRVSV